MSDRESRNGTPGALNRATASQAGAPKVTSLGDLPREITPPRDLWPEIEARLGGTRTGTTRLWALPSVRPQYFAIAAALVIAVGVGILIGRGLLPGGRGASVISNAPSPQALPALFIKDPRYLRERAQLLQSLNARLAALPPQSRQKVLASLATIHQSMRDIQAALGREPGNALLQELLVDTYQDEMHVLATVQEASAGSGEI
jgi:hypothetical protein